MNVKDARILIERIKALDLQASRRLWDFDGAILYGPNSDETGIAMDNPADAEFLAVVRNSCDILCALAEVALTTRGDSEPLFAENQATPVYQLHYKLGDKTAIVQKPVEQLPQHDDVIRWGQEALGVESLSGATVDLVQESDPRFVGTISSSNITD